MSYREKTIVVSLVNFLLILGFFLFRVFQMLLDRSFNSAAVFRLWEIVLVLAILVTILATILTHIVSGILQAIKTGGEPAIDDLQDERDKSIDLKGARVSYVVFSSGVFLSMLTFALGQPPLAMFTLLIFFGIAARITGDISRLYLYRRGS